MLRVKHDRLARGWSQVRVAFYAGMSVGDVSRIENGRLIPYPSQLDKLANVFSVDRQELLKDVSAELDVAEGDARPNRGRSMPPAPLAIA